MNKEVQHLISIIKNIQIKKYGTISKKLYNYLTDENILTLKIAFDDIIGVCQDFYYQNKSFPNKYDLSLLISHYISGLQLNFENRIIILDRFLTNEILDELAKKILYYFEISYNNNKINREYHFA